MQMAVVVRTPGKLCLFGPLDPLHRMVPGALGLCLGRSDSQRLGGGVNRIPENWAEERRGKGPAIKRPRTAGKTLAQYRKRCRPSSGQQQTPVRPKAAECGASQCLSSLQCTVNQRSSEVGLRHVRSKLIVRLANVGMKGTPVAEPSASIDACSRRKKAPTYVPKLEVCCIFLLVSYLHPNVYHPRTFRGGGWQSTARG